MNHVTPNPEPRHSAFWPVFLLASSIGVFLAWQVVEGVGQRRALRQVSQRQTELAAQASEAEQRLQSMMLDLIDLAKDDEDARAIITKYNIKFNPGATNGPLPCVTKPALPGPETAPAAPAAKPKTTPSAEPAASDAKPAAAPKPEAAPAAEPEDAAK